MNVWSSNIAGPGRTLTLEDLQATIDRINSAEAREAERQRVRRNIDAYLALKLAAEKAGVSDHIDVVTALGYASMGVPISPELFERVRALLGEDA